MKKVILFFAMAAMFAACKKDKDNNEFTPTDVTGITMVKGNTSKTMITPDGAGGWTNQTKVAAPNVNVAVTVNRNSLYPNSNAQGADVYSAVTDANGNYNIAVKTNATGVIAKITIDGFTGTMDTLVNGVIKKGLYSNFAGKTMTTTLVVGQNYTLDHNFFASNATTNPNQLDMGTAEVTGVLEIEKIKESIVGGNPPTYGPGYVVLPNHKVYLRIDKDPSTLASKVYETTTDAWGGYRFIVSTVPAGQQGFAQLADIWVEDYAASRDTILLNQTVKVGIHGVYRKTLPLQINGVYNKAVRNGNKIYYNNFKPN